jgi:hypothetical protein
MVSCLLMQWVLTTLYRPSITEIEGEVIDLNKFSLGG